MIPARIERHELMSLRRVLLLEEVKKTLRLYNDSPNSDVYLLVVDHELDQGNNFTKMEFTYMF